MNRLMSPTVCEWLNLATSLWCVCVCVCERVYIGHEQGSNEGNISLCANRGTVLSNV